MKISAKYFRKRQAKSERKPKVLKIIEGFKNMGLEENVKRSAGHTKLQSIKCRSSSESAIKQQ